MPQAWGRTGWLVAAGLVLALALAIAVATRLTAPFDRAAVDALRSPDLAVALRPLALLTELGSTEAVTIVAGVAILVSVAVGPWRHGVIGAVVIGATSVANSIIKSFVARERPALLEPIIVEHGFSFPSGHAVLGMTAWGILAVLVSRSRLPAVARRVIVVATAVLIALIGVSRVYLGVHYPTDVLAGWTLGAVIVLLYERLTRTVSREPAAGAVDEDPAAPRSDRPGAG